MRQLAVSEQRKIPEFHVFNPSKNGKIRNKKTGEMMNTFEYYAWVKDGIKDYSAMPGLTGVFKDFNNLALAVNIRTGHSPSLSASIAQNLVDRGYVKKFGPFYAIKKVHKVKAGKA